MKYETIKKQDIKAGVILKGYKKLTFNDHKWYDTDNVTSTVLDADSNVTVDWEYSSDELISLVNLIVKVNDGDGYLIKNKYGETREFYTKHNAYEKMINDYDKELYISLDQTTKYFLDEEKMKLLIYGKKSIAHGGKNPTEYEVVAGTIPSVYTTVDYPLHYDFLCTENGTYVLNHGSMYKTLDSKQDNEKAAHFIQMIYRNLCAYPALKGTTATQEREILLDKVLLNNYTEDEKDFKFVINWISALVQKPGINLMTNIWFSGLYQGIGKGTLVSFLKEILGENKTTLMKPNMITGSFNASLAGKFILEINEKQEGITPLQLSNWLKGFSQETHIQIEQKNQDPFMSINMINIIGTSQDTADVFKIEDGDRRNVIFQTVDQDLDDNLSARRHAKYIAVSAKEDISWGQSVAWVLERVDIDWNLLNTAYKTRSYDKAKSNQVEGSNSLYFWAQSKLQEYKKNGNPITAKDMFSEYQENNYLIKTQTTFNKKLKDLVGINGIVDFELKKPANILTVYFGSDDGGEVITETNIHQKLDKLSEMRKQLKRKP